MNPVGLLILAAGAFAMCGAIFNWNFFFASRKARLALSLLGREGARLFYGLLGAALCVWGALMTLGLATDLAKDQKVAPVVPAAPQLPSRTVPLVAGAEVQIEYEGTPQDADSDRIGKWAMKVIRPTQVSTDFIQRITTLSGIADAQAVAALMDFAEVLEVNAEQRRIRIRLPLRTPD